MAKKIIVAPLNWGLGHASRCVVIIRLLLENKYVPILASDGVALLFLRKEFPDLPFLELPSYRISYSKNIKRNLLLQSPKILKAVKKERKIIEDFITKNTDVVGIVSDNRFGVRSTSIPSVYLTHQLKVLSGFTTFFTSFVHRYIIAKFDECWIPDSPNSEFSGKLSAVKNYRFQTKFIGVLSRFKQQNLPIKNDLLIVLSGPEPNRTHLENWLKAIFKDAINNVVMVLGKIENEQQRTTEKNLTIYNYLLTEQLEKELNQSELVLCRSGYSSIMDLAVLGKKAFFIPTKNQPEQEYLAAFLSESKQVAFAVETEFTLEKLEANKAHKSLATNQKKLDSKLLSLFKSK